MGNTGKRPAGGAGAIAGGLLLGTAHSAHMSSCAWAVLCWMVIMCRCKCQCLLLMTTPTPPLLHCALRAARRAGRIQASQPPWCSYIWCVRDCHPFAWRAEMARAHSAHRQRARAAAGPPPPPPPLTALQRRPALSRDRTQAATQAHTYTQKYMLKMLHQHPSALHATA